MSYNPQLWQELGLNTWQLKPEFQTSQSEQTSTPTSEPIEASFDSISEQTTPTYAPEASELKKLVLFGRGLQAIWKQAENPAWQLWRAILNFHLSKPEQLVFYDTANISDEDKIYDVLDDLAEKGIELAFSMDSEHPINEFLAENIQLIFLPSLEEMLEQSILKKDLFIKLSQEFPWQAK